MQIELTRQTTSRNGRQHHDYYTIDGCQYKVSYNKSYGTVEIRTQGKRPEWVDFIYVNRWNDGGGIEIPKVTFTPETFSHLPWLHDLVVTGIESLKDKQNE